MRVRGLPGLAGQSLTQGGRVMRDHSEAFVAFDTSKLRNAVAIAEAGRSGEVRFLGEIDNTAGATAKLVKKLAAKYGRLSFCYEAGPTGYGLYRQISQLGHDCIVAAPSLIPKKPGDRVKTNRRDAVGLAKLSRAGDLTAFSGASSNINRAEAGAGPRQGELPSLLRGRSHDRRPISDRDSPGRTNGNAVSNPRIR